MPYRQLDEANIIQTLERLKLRISERFPESGLSKVAAELLTVGREISDTVRYLELLSVNSKLAALLVEHFNDEVVLGAVNEIETLTTGLSGKIWQKIRLIERPGASAI